MSSAARRIDDLSLPTTSEAEIAKKSSRLLAACIGDGETARLKVVDNNGEIDVPVSALRLLVDILAQMAQGNGVTLMPIHAQLTTQEAADFLNVSRPYVVKLIDTQALPAERVGTHRRIRFEDLLKYRQNSLHHRKKILAEMTREAQEDGSYD